MKQHFLIQQNHERLLLFFAGWGMDEKPFRCFQPKGCDWMICYDYRSFEFNADILTNYKEIIVVGWSMGVWVASEIMQYHPGLRIKKSIAVNGTVYPIDDQKGIPVKIYEGTLEGLSESTLQKFQRRMCGTIAEYKAFQLTAPQRPIDELKDELIKIRERYLSSALRMHTEPNDYSTVAVPSASYTHSNSSNPLAFHWQYAIVGEVDRIFPVANQLEAWSKDAERVEQVNEPHYSHELFSKLFS